MLKLNHLRLSKQVDLIGTISYWSAIETFDSNRAPRNIGVFFEGEVS